MAKHRRKSSSIAFAETLARARVAAALPWSDLTQALLAELRFKSIANWLPQQEADRMRADFEAELVRLYAVMDAASASL